jgi:hypothetical protein
MVDRPGQIRVVSPLSPLQGGLEATVEAKALDSGGATSSVIASTQ